MAKRVNDEERLRAENERLLAENERLQQSVAAKSAAKTGFFRRLGAALLAVLAVLLLVVANLLFWTGNTVVNNQRFMEATAPVIRNSDVQKALASYTTTQLYSNVNVTQYVQDALPPRAEFLAPTIAGQLRGFTNTALQKLLARPQFQDRVNEALSRSQARFIATVKQSGGDGTINLNDVYQQLSNSLKGTKLSFLAGKQLPAKVGTVQVVSGNGITVLHAVANNINTWRIVAVVLFVVCFVLAVYLARRRRRMVVTLSLCVAAGLFVSLVVVRVAREVIAGRVAEAYSDAVRQAAQILLHPLVVQTTTLLCIFLVVAFVAWVSGSSRSAHYIQSRVQFLLAGKLHQAVFGAHENALTIWIGAHKRVLQWVAVAVVALLALVTRLTLKTLGVYAVVLLLLILIIELLGAPAERRA